MKNALTIFRGTTSEAALAKVQADRAAILARIAEHDAKRASHIETADIEDIDAADIKAAADRRALAILDQKIKVLEISLKQEAHDRRELAKRDAIRLEYQNWQSAISTGRPRWKRPSSALSNSTT